MRQKILVKGPALTRSGYGEHARFVLRSLRTKEDIFDIYIQPIKWGNTSWINEYDEEKKWIDACIEKTIAYIQQGGQFDISVQVSIPNEFEQLAATNIGCTAGIETTKVAPEWLMKTNAMDKTIVVSQHSKNVFESTKYDGTHPQTQQPFSLTSEKPIDVVNYPVKIYEELPTLNLPELKHDFNFLCIAQAGPRKNLPNTIGWFIQEFHDESVGLIIKTNKARNCLADRELIRHDMRSLVTQFPNKKCSVYLLHGDMSDEEIHSLYTHEKIKAFVCLSHGEGFGLPFFEAAYSGMPVVCAGYSGQMDFLTTTEGKDKFYNVAYDLQAVPSEVVWDGVIIKESMWAYPREESAKNKMRQCYEDVLGGVGIAADASTHAADLKERFSFEKMAQAMCDAIYTSSPEEEEWLHTLSQIETL